MLYASIDNLQYIQVSDGQSMVDFQGFRVDGKEVHADRLQQGTSGKSKQND